MSKPPQSILASGVAQRAITVLRLIDSKLELGDPAEEVRQLCRTSIEELEDIRDKHREMGR